MESATPNHGTIVVPVDELCERIASIVATKGAPAVVADEVARHLVRAQQSGHASHGVLRLVQYISEIESGQLDPRARAEVVSRAGAAAVVDGHMSFGQYAASVATDEAIAAAERLGVGIATIRNSTHVGRLGEYAERIAERGLIGLMQVGAVGLGVGGMRPFGSVAPEPYLNTNPWCISVPAQPGPVVFDGSMTTIAEGKVHAARDKGETLPEGGIIDADGNPSTDPADYYAGGSLLPLGGAVAGHKGYGLALTAALLGGLAYADGSPAILRGIAPVRHADGAPSSLGGVTITAIDPSMFGDRAAYAEAVTRTVAAIRATGALVPGDMEYRNREAAKASVEVPSTTMGDLLALERQVSIR